MVWNMHANEKISIRQIKEKVTSYPFHGALLCSIISLANNKMVFPDRSPCIFIVYRSIHWQEKN